MLNRNETVQVTAVTVCMCVCVCVYGTSRFEWERHCRTKWHGKVKLCSAVSWYFGRETCSQLTQRADATKLAWCSIVLFTVYLCSTLWRSRVRPNWPLWWWLSSSEIEKNPNLNLNLFHSRWQLWACVRVDDGDRVRVCVCEWSWLHQRWMHFKWNCGRYFAKQ